MNQVVVITGLAQGMGRQVAKMLAQSGDTIAGFDMNQADLDSLSKELTAIGGDHLLEPINILDRDKILAFRDRVMEKYNRVDIVLSNIGIGFFGPFEETDLAKAAQCIEINVMGTAAVFQAFIPAMRENKNFKFHNQVDFMSRFFLFLNMILPRSVRNHILLSHMKIK